MLTSGLMASKTLPAALAHQLAHIEAGDGRLTAAIARLTLTPPRPPDLADSHEPPQQPHRHGIKRLTAFTLKYARGGYGIRLLHHLWQSATITAEHRADTRAADRGQRLQLIAALAEGHTTCTGPIVHPHIPQPRRPEAQERIDRLQAGGDA